MATREQLNRFVISGQVGYTIPYYKDIGPAEIRLWSPDPDSGEDYHLSTEMVQKVPGDDESWVIRYTNIGKAWDQSVKDFFAEIEMEFMDRWKAMVCTNIPEHLFEKDGWKIVEFGLAHMDYGNLIARVKWEKGSSAEVTDQYITAYTWPPC